MGLLRYGGTKMKILYYVILFANFITALSCAILTFRARKILEEYNHFLKSTIKINSENYLKNLRKFQADVNGLRDQNNLASAAHDVVRAQLSTLKDQYLKQTRDCTCRVTRQISYDEHKLSPRIDNPDEPTTLGQNVSSALPQEK